MLHLYGPIKPLAKFGACALRSKLFGNGALAKLAISPCSTLCGLT